MKYVLILAALVSIGSQASEQIIDDLLSERDYNGIKETLYNGNYDVLDRKQGASIFDKTLALKDKRLAVIVADYHNSSAKEKEIERVKIKINQLEVSIAEASEETSELEHLEQIKADFERQLRQLVIESNTEDLKGRVLKLEESVEFLLQNIMLQNEKHVDSRNKLEVVSKLMLESKGTKQQSPKI
ncbi:TPA: hypothetical protein I7730_14400 [Vibrio vulnificus]|uniref:Uncharacterized protein n=1 Tax=Vibrio vulnificus TaxID=672 RepID=A0A8H9N1B2_VIBVL|nr:hypothetical protein [Vibrio vulnificus]HAS8540978.1 hypothetical protein [Vibrio vulnificus]